MLLYDRIDVSGGIDVNKTSASKERDICHYWYFLDKPFQFQSHIYNGCHNVLMMSVMMSVRGVYYRCVVNRISKSEAANLLQNADLTKREDYYKKNK